jgi:hypothetical protein
VDLPVPRAPNKKKLLVRNGFCNLGIHAPKMYAILGLLLLAAFQHLGTRVSCDFTPDYLIEDSPERPVVEIGGCGKGREQFKGVEIDRKLVFAHSPAPERHRLPLFLLGYLSRGLDSAIDECEQMPRLLVVSPLEFGADRSPRRLFSWIFSCTKGSATPGERRRDASLSRESYLTERKW